MQIDPFLLLRAYAIGVFPMSDDRDVDDVYWVEPKRRAVLPLEAFHLSRSLAKTIRSERFAVSVNRAFRDVVQLCAEAAPDRPTTWINHAIEKSYVRLHELGFAHSIECRIGGELVGGLYGVSLGRAFFGESMFSRATDASKVALAWLVARLRAAGCTLLDCQFMTDHLRSLGAVEIERDAYHSLLSAALSDVSLAEETALLSTGPGPEAAEAFAPDLSPSFTVSGPVSGHFITQLLTQTS
ncbi:MAG: leucyl/phenylalanyl-tRNA--protein transferase [Sphingobium sp.]